MIYALYAPNHSRALKQKVELIAKNKYKGDGIHYFRSLQTVPRVSTWDSLDEKLRQLGKLEFEIRIIPILFSTTQSFLR